MPIRIALALTAALACGGCVSPAIEQTPLPVNAASDAHVRFGSVTGSAASGHVTVRGAAESRAPAFSTLQPGTIHVVALRRGVSIANADTKWSPRRTARLSRRYFGWFSVELPAAARAADTLAVSHGHSRPFQTPTGIQK